MPEPAAPASPTVNDVARLARVSRQTVSNVLNAPQRVAPDTAARVRDAIAELGYQPHRLARNLKARNSRLIGYQVPHVEPGSLHPVLDRFLHALTEEACAQGYHMLLFTPAKGQDALEAHAELVGTRTVDGFVLSEVDYGDPRVTALAEAGVAFVAFGRPEVGMAHDWVDVDGAAGTREAVLHLAARGHERIALVGWPVGSATGDRRAEGFLAGLADAGLGTEPAYDVRVEDSLEQGAEALRTLLARPEPPTAVVCVSDLLAMGVLQEAHTRRLGVPADLAVTGFDDTPVAPFLTPALTTVRQPLEEVARRIVARLADRLGGTPFDPEGELVAPSLVLRQST